jgi:hypothetical protein
MLIFTGSAHKHLEYLFYCKMSSLECTAAIAILVTTIFAASNIPTNALAQRGGGCGERRGKRVT